MAVAYRALGMQIYEGVVEAGFPQRPAHSAVFAHIDRTGTRLGTLARRANMTPQAMGELVDDLERMGYVRRRADPQDRRAKLIVLTAKGTRCIDAGLATIARIERALEAKLGPRRLRELQRGLEQIIQDWPPDA
jgi:DNA-binding MarR family transcriptional regulator